MIACSFSLPVTMRSGEPRLKAHAGAGIAFLVPHRLDLDGLCAELEAVVFLDRHIAQRLKGCGQRLDILFAEAGIGDLRQHVLIELLGWRRIRNGPERSLGRQRVA
jgi:hypothetical protein